MLNTSSNGLSKACTCYRKIPARHQLPQPCWPASERASGPSPRSVGCSCGACPPCPPEPTQNGGRGRGGDRLGPTAPKGDKVLYEISPPPPYFNQQIQRTASRVAAAFASENKAGARSPFVVLLGAPPLIAAARPPSPPRACTAAREDTAERRPQGHRHADTDRLRSRRPRSTWQRPGERRCFWDRAQPLQRRKYTRSETDARKALARLTLPTSRRITCETRPLPVGAATLARVQQHPAQPHTGEGLSSSQWSVRACPRVRPVSKPPDALPKPSLAFRHAVPSPIWQVLPCSPF